MQLLDRNVDGKKVYAVGLTSPQELTNEAARSLGKSGFCKFEKVITRIRKRIKKCDSESPTEDYILLIPCTLFVENGKINEKCITEPMKWLDTEGFKVFVVHLRKDYDFSYLEDTLMKEIGTEPKKTIKSQKDGYDKQAKELENFIRTL
jgi:hypothetical protein